MSAKANAFSIAQLLDSTNADVQDYVRAKTMLGKLTSHHQIELDLEGQYLKSSTIFIAKLKGNNEIYKTTHVVENCLVTG